MNLQIIWMSDPLHGCKNTSNLKRTLLAWSSLMTLASWTLSALMSFTTKTSDLFTIKALLTRKRFSHPSLRIIADIDSQQIRREAPCCQIILYPCCQSDQVLLPSSWCFNWCEIANTSKLKVPVAMHLAHTDFTSYRLSSR